LSDFLAERQNRGQLFKETQQQGIIEQEILENCGMNATHTHKLKNGDLIIFKTNMTESEVEGLPILANQHEFYSYQIEIDLIIKNFNSL
jgi:hypothetical protein